MCVCVCLLREQLFASACQFVCVSYVSFIRTFVRLFIRFSFCMRCCYFLLNTILVCMYLVVSSMMYTHRRKLWFYLSRIHNLCVCTFYMMIDILKILDTTEESISKTEDRWKFNRNERIKEQVGKKMKIIESKNIITSLKYVETTTTATTT